MLKITAKEKEFILRQRAKGFRKDELPERDLEAVADIAYKAMFTALNKRKWFGEKHPKAQRKMLGEVAQLILVRAS